MATLIDLTKELDEIYHELTPKERYKAMRNTMLWAGRQVRKEAVKNLEAMPHVPDERHGSTGPKGLKKSIRVKDFRKKVGFYVTVAESRKGGGVHTNRWGKPKPAARWLETGTAAKGKGHKAAPQPPRSFLGKAWKSKEAEVRRKIAETFEKKVVAIAKKHNG